MLPSRVRACRLANVVGAALALTALLAPAAGATFPGRNGAIAFIGENCPEEDPGPCSDILYSAHADATHASHRLDLKLKYPAYSASGRKLAVVLNADDFLDLGEGRLAVITADGTRLRKLPRKGRSPAWSPDGTHLAYEHEGVIYTVRSDGRDRRTLGPGEQPDWSINNEIAFTANNRIATMSPTGRHLRVLTRFGSYSPNWSPDGRRLVAVRVGGEHQSYPIFVVRRDGRQLHRLTHAFEDGSYPVWSPDGKSIIFEWNFDVWMMGADGHHRRALHLADGGGEHPVGKEDVGEDGIAWQPLPRPSPR